MYSKGIYSNITGITTYPDEVRLKQRAKEYYEKNKDKINQKYKCPCGSVYMKRRKTPHEKTKKHLKYLNNI